VFKRKLEKKTNPLYFFPSLPSLSAQTQSQPISLAPARAQPSSTDDPARPTSSPPHALPPPATDSWGASSPTSDHFRLGLVPESARRTLGGLGPAGQRGPPAYLSAADSASTPQALAPPPVRQTLAHSAAAEPCCTVVLDPLYRCLPVVKE
jgi:hypothetical protein